MARQLHDSNRHSMPVEFHTTKTTPHGKNQSLHYLDRKQRSRAPVGGKQHVDGRAVLPFDAHHSRPAERMYRHDDRYVQMAYTRGHSGQHKGMVTANEIPTVTTMPVRRDTTRDLADAFHPLHAVPADALHNASGYVHAARNYQTTAGETRDFVVENHGNAQQSTGNSAVTTSHGTTTGTARAP